MTNIKIWLRNSPRKPLHCFSKIGKRSGLEISLCNNAYANVTPDTNDQVTSTTLGQRCLNCLKILYPSHMNRSVK